MNTDKIYAEQIANEYAPKDTSKVVALRKLDAKAKLPASFTPLAQQLVGIVYEQSDQEGDMSDRAAFIQKKAEELGV